MPFNEKVAMMEKNLKSFIELAPRGRRFFQCSCHIVGQLSPCRESYHSSWEENLENEKGTFQRTA